MQTPWPIFPPQIRVTLYGISVRLPRIERLEMVRTHSCVQYCNFTERFNIKIFSKNNRYHCTINLTQRRQSILSGVEVDMGHALLHLRSIRHLRKWESEGKLKLKTFYVKCSIKEWRIFLWWLLLVSVAYCLKVRLVHMGYDWIYISSVWTKHQKTRSRLKNLWELDLVFPIFPSLDPDRSWSRISEFRSRSLHTT